MWNTVGFQEMRPETMEHSRVRFISGIICKSKVQIFERMLFRATRGNMLFNQAPAGEDIVDPATSESVPTFFSKIKSTAQTPFLLIKFFIDNLSSKFIYFCVVLWKLVLEQSLTTSFVFALAG